MYINVFVGLYICFREYEAVGMYMYTLVVLYATATAAPRPREPARWPCATEHIIWF